MMTCIYSDIGTELYAPEPKTNQPSVTMWHDLRAAHTAQWQLDGTR
jgi:hypothetical protein